MSKRKALRVIPGGKSGDFGPPGDSERTESHARLLQRADRYRALAAAKPEKEVASLVSDLFDAIRALNLLEQSPDPTAHRRALEYHRLIAELELEIVTALHDS